MKVTLDLGQLLADGKITQAEFDRFSALAGESTGSLAFNILIGFGVIAVSLGALALVPFPTTAIVIGLIVAANGLLAMFGASQSWAVFGNICLLAGALMFGGGIVIANNGSVESFAIIAVVFTAVAIIARSSLLIAIAVLALAACLGARTGYMHAVYSLGIREPTLTIVVFSLLALATYLASKRLPWSYAKLAITAARTSLLLVNFGFWIGSLWGDRLNPSTWLSTPTEAATEGSSLLVIPDWAFVIAWAIALVAVGIWATAANRRWVINLVAVFGAIHFYTQWFERLGASPASVLGAGLLALGLAIGLWHLNRAMRGGEKVRTS